MNKMVPHKQKEVLVIKLIFIVSLFLFSCSVSKQITTDVEKDDYAVLNSILETSKAISKNEKICLFENYSNDYVIEIIKSQMNKISSKTSINSGYEFIEIEMDSTVKKIFTEKSYNFLLSQSSVSDWDGNKVVSNVVICDKSKQVESFSSYKISRPIYTGDGKYALVCINKMTWQGIAIMEKKGKLWKEYKLIAPILIQAKAQLTD